MLPRLYITERDIRGHRFSLSLSLSPFFLFYIPLIEPSCGQYKCCTGRNFNKHKAKLWSAYIPTYFVQIWNQKWTIIGTKAFPMIKYSKFVSLLLPSPYSILRGISLAFIRVRSTNYRHFHQELGKTRDDLSVCIPTRTWSVAL